MRALVSIVLVLSIGAIGFQLYRLYIQKIALEKNLENINAQTKPLIDENKNLLGEINYLKDPDNLEKELRSRFNYAYPGEKLIIIVPQ